MPNNLIAADLQVKGRASYLILCQTVNDLASRQKDAPPYFNAIRDDILRFANELPNGKEESLIVHRRALMEVFRDIFTLNLYVDIVRDWLVHGSLLYEAALIKESVPVEGKTLFLTHLQAMIDLSGQKDGVAAHVLQLAVSHIPLRMATLKYKSYVEDSVKKSDISPEALNIDSFKRFFNPTAFLPDNEWINELRKPLDEIWDKDCAAMNKDGLLEDFKAVNNVRTKVTSLVDYLCVLFDGINAAYITLRHCPNDYNSDEMRNLNESQLDEAVEAELQKVIYGPEGEVRPDTEIADPNDPLYEENKRITEMFYETGLDYFGITANNKSEVKSDAESFLAEFLPYLETSGLTANRKRFLRQHLMAYLPYPYSIEDYQKYFLDTYAALDDANRRYLCAYVANQVKESQEKNGK